MPSFKDYTKRRLEPALCQVVPLQPRPGKRSTEASFMRVDAPNVIVEAVKGAEDVPEALVIRLYECEGRGARAVLRFGFPVAAAAETNLLEEVVAPLDLHEGQVALAFRPFEIKTVRVARERC